ncbi:MAG: amidase family protein [Acidimicrobiales bacterium]|nr:amidase family protein [Acidimicrobiales bacterium]MDG2217249.1 amidase family protein [Acidimicrobiales bacterium]
MIPLWTLAARDIAARVRSQALTAAEVTEAHLARIEEIEPDMNAIVLRRDAAARAEAAAVDASIARGEDPGPLAGVPATVKLNIDVAGEPTTDGVAALAHNTAPRDAPIVARLRAAGAIIVGRTNLPDAGMRIDTASELYGRTHNPWRRGITAGGSSGGEGASLATGMSAIGLGNDLGGSLRNPATANSIASIKPTVGRVPSHRRFDGRETLSDILIASDGPMARSVDDVELLLGVIAGADPMDPVSVPVPLVLPERRTNRVALMAEIPDVDVDPHVSEIIRAASRALAETGVTIVETIPPQWGDVISCWSTLVLGGLDPQDPGGAEMIVGDVVGEFLVTAATFAAERGLVSPTHGWGMRHYLQREWELWFADFDAVLTPVWTGRPFAADADLNGTEGADLTLNMLRTVMPGNVLGLPSAAVPAGLADGLPVGALLTGPLWSDLRMLELAKSIEAALAPKTPINPQ